jgi:hypothetical protein
MCYFFLVDGVYLHEKALFNRLVATQERMTAAILDLFMDKK